MATTVTLKPNAIDISGSTSGTTTLQATAVAGTTTLTLPAATDTLVGKATTDTLTNKTLTTPSVSSPTISDGTANGVPYLNGSKVLTTGSALVFDGTNFSTTGSATVKNLFFTGGTLPGAGNPSLALRSSDNSIYLQSGSANQINFLDSAQNAMYVATATQHTWNISNVEKARITSGGDLLVGATTNNFGGRLEIVATGNMPGGGVKNDNSAQPTLGVWNAATTGDNVFTRFLTEAGGTARGTISYNRAGGLVAYNTTSDYRSKVISGPIIDSGALIDSVPVYMGKMKDATQERPMFIAHETPAYAHIGEKDAVDKDGSPVYQQMDASALIPVMWAEIQSLRKRLAALESA